MIENILREIREPEDYKAAMRLFEGGQEMTQEEADRIFGIYSKHVPAQGNEDILRLIFALDLYRRGDIGKSGLSDREREALAMAVQIATDTETDSDMHLSAVEDMVEEEGIRLPVRILLARIVLDRLVIEREMESVAETVRKLAAFLRVQEDETLYLITKEITEVRMRCRTRR